MIFVFIQPKKKGGDSRPAILSVCLIKFSLHVYTDFNKISLKMQIIILYNVYKFTYSESRGTSDTSIFNGKVHNSRNTKGTSQINNTINKPRLKTVLDSLHDFKRFGPIKAA